MMIGNTFNIGHKIIRFKVRLAAMIDKSTLIPVVGSIYAQREEVIKLFDLMLLVK
jgi:hypothetical protein